MFLVPGHGILAIPDYHHTFGARIAFGRHSAIRRAVLNGPFLIILIEYLCTKLKVVVLWACSCDWQGWIQSFLACCSDPLKKRQLRFGNVAPCGPFLTLILRLSHNDLIELRVCA